MRLSIYCICVSAISASLPSASFDGGIDELNKESKSTPYRKENQLGAYFVFQTGSSHELPEDMKENGNGDGTQYDVDSVRCREGNVPELSDCGQSAADYSKEVDEPLYYKAAVFNLSNFHWTGIDGEFEVGCYENVEYSPSTIIGGDIICNAMRFTETSIIDFFYIAINLREDKIKLELEDPTRLVDRDLMDRVERFGAALNSETGERGGILGDDHITALKQALQFAWDSSTNTVAAPAGSSAAVLTVKAVLGDREFVDLKFEFQNVDNYSILPIDAFIDLNDCIVDRTVRIGIHVPRNPTEKVILYPYDGKPLENGPMRTMLTQITEIRVAVSVLAPKGSYYLALGRHIDERITIDWCLKLLHPRSHF